MNARQLVAAATVLGLVTFGACNAKKPNTRHYEGEAAKPKLTLADRMHALKLGGRMDAGSWDGVIYRVPGGWVWNWNDAMVFIPYSVEGKK